MVCQSLFLTDSWAARSYHSVGSSSGLEARVAVSLAFDRAGFLWVGSREGLFRYDGYQTIAYLPDPSDPDSISDADIRFVYESDDGHIWVGTNTGGLNVLNPETGVFRHFRHNPSDVDSLPDDSVYGIVEDREGAIWIATQEGLARLDRSSGSFEIFRHDPEDPGSLAHNWTYHLHVGPVGNLWISSVGGGLAGSQFSWLVEMDQVYVCDGGESVLVGFPGGLREAIAGGAEFGRCEFILD